MACPIMFFIIVREMSGFVRPYGLRNSSELVGISVARAKEASVSMIKLTHNIWTAFRGLSCWVQWGGGDSKELDN